MCIIALKPAGALITDSIIENMWNNNSDGAGFMYAERGSVKIVKGLMTLKDFSNALHCIGQRRKLVMHFRIRTHGAVSKKLTHPFWVKKGRLAMVHNGIISSVGHSETSEHESDTSLYAKKLCARYRDPLESLTNPFEYEKMVKEIGWSKLVFLTGDNEHQIVNEKSGTWSNGVWYSNHGFESTYGYSWGSYRSGTSTGETWESMLARYEERYGSMD